MNDTEGGAAPSHEFSREMGLDHAEFFRSLPAAIGHRDYLRSGNQVRVDLGEARHVVFDLGAERVRAIALLRLPVTPVRFRFYGLDDDAFEAFMRRFDLCFRRGGG